MDAPPPRERELDFEQSFASSVSGLSSTMDAVHHDVDDGGPVQILMEELKRAKDYMGTLEEKLESQQKELARTRRDTRSLKQKLSSDEARLPQEQALAEKARRRSAAVSRRSALAACSLCVPRGARCCWGALRPSRARARRTWRTSCARPRRSRAI